jgi:hypothetical protein
VNGGRVEHEIMTAFGQRAKPRPRSAGILFTSRIWVGGLWPPVTEPDGRFRVALPPGAYRVTEGICAVSGRVEVRVGATVSVTLRMLSAAC